MEDTSREGTVYAVVTLLSAVGAVVSPHPLARLLFSLAAIGGAAKTADCFHKSAQAAYQQLTTPREYRQLLPHAYHE